MLKNWTVTCKKVNLDHYLTPYTKINSKWIIDFNARPETTKLLKRTLGSMFFDVGLSNIYHSGYVSSGKGNKANKYDQIKLKRKYQQNKKTTTE